MQTCGANARAVHVEWRDAAGRTHLVGDTGLGWMMGKDPNLALSVLYGLGRWEAGRSTGGMDPQRKGWLRVGEGGGETRSGSSSNNNTSGTSGERTPPAKTPKPKRPPRAPRRSPATSRVARKSPSPPKPRPSLRPCPSQGQGQGQALHQTPSPPLENGGRDPYGNVPGVGDTRYVP